MEELTTKIAWFFIYFWTSMLFICLFFWFRLTWLKKKFNRSVIYNRTLAKFWIWNINNLKK